MSLMHKRMLSTVVGYVMMVLIATSATFATGDHAGLGLVVEGYEWLNTVSNNFSIFVNIIAIILAITGALVLFGLTVNTQNQILTSNKALLERYTVEDALISVKPRPYQLILVSLPYWIYLISCGWIYVTLSFMFFHLTMQANNALQHKQLKEKINESTNSTADDLRKSAL